MGSMQRHLVWEVLQVFLLTVAASMLLMTLAGGAKEGVRRGLPLILVLQTMPYFVPEALRFTIPGSLLFAVCSTFGRFSASNEFVAIKAMGIHPLAVVWPVLALSAVLSVITAGMYDVCAAWSRPAMRRILAESVDHIAYSYLNAHHAFSTNGLSMTVRGVEQQRLIDPVISVAPPMSPMPITLTAREARLSSAGYDGTLRIECRDGFVEVEGVGVGHFPGEFAREVTLDDRKPQDENTLAPAALSSRATARQVVLERDRIAALRRLVLSQPEIEAPQHLASEIERRELRLFRLRAELPRRMSNGAACLCFALIGIPVSLLSRSRDTMSTFFLCFGPIMLLFYPLLVIGENLARNGVFPELSVWLADAILLSIGGILLYRIARR
jgi:lipopolysaccharide export system permease protein